ncbi:MAG: type II toxin-antitoxin system VapC family toxin [Caulobacteraceae bacterium]
MIQLDTHMLVWLASRLVGWLSPLARRLVERESLQISPMVALELETLYEAGRLRSEAGRVLAVVERDYGLSRSQARFAAVIEAARSFAWTRDPFDRLIVANAMADAARLITADATILANFTGAVW